MLGEWWLLFLVLNTTAALSAAARSSASQVPCYFIFGDSLVDNGNNNNMMASLARANYPPYGIDFPDGPTGRFTNGLTTVDVLAKLLGFEEYIPPHVKVGEGQQLLKGVNFASAAAGIREETGRQLGSRIYLAGQVQNYQTVVQQVVKIMGDDAAAAEKHLSKCIFTVGMGSNDYLNNYFMPGFYTTDQLFTPEAYAHDLIQTYSQQLQILYNYGARKVALIGLGQIGCSPNLLARRSPNGISCVANINSAIQMFNKKLIHLVDQFNKLQGANFTYINSYDIFQDILRNAPANGIKYTNRGCCGVGRNNAQITCLPYQPPCENRSEYIFWDAFHPSQAANVLVAQRFYSAQSPSDAYPVDIKRLAQI